MQKQLEQLDEFNRTFGTYVNEAPTGLVPTDIWELRVKLLQEELDEYKRAAWQGEIIEVADALADLLYVLLGTVYAHGLQNHIEAAFDEVHASNMSKLDENGKAILREDGKVIKSSRYFRPDIAGTLKVNPATRPESDE